MTEQPNTQNEQPTQESIMTMLCPGCDELIVMENGIMMCQCGFAPNHGAD